MAYRNSVASSDKWRSVEWETPNTSLPPQAPEHPIPTMQGAFEESMLETISDDADGTAELLNADSLARRRRLLVSRTYERTVAGRWKQKQGENFHPLWKLVAQISFGMHLLHRGLAKSDDEVIRILQTHVDEVDGFLERTTEDLDLAQRDINERVRYLKLPLEHGDVFDNMLGVRKFRTKILEGNEKIEHIVDRTSVALRDTLKDVKKGLDGTKELARYFKKLDKTWERNTEEHVGVYGAMVGNTEGWTGAYIELQKKGNVLHESLVHLGGIIAEIQRRVGVASRKDIPSTMTSRSNTQPSSRVPSAPQSPRRHSPQPGFSNPEQRSASDSRHQSQAPWTGDRHRRHASADSISSEKKEHGRKVSFSDKTKNKGSNLAISPKGPHNMSPEQRRFEKSMPKTARDYVPMTPWDETNGHAISVRDTVKNDKNQRRSMSASTPHTPYDLDAILRPDSKASQVPPLPSAGLPSALPSAAPSTASSYYGPGRESQMPGMPSAGLFSAVPSLPSPYRPPPLRMSESVNSPPIPKRIGRNSLPDEAIKEEEEEEEPMPPQQDHAKDDTESEEDDFQAEIIDAQVQEARPREMSISGRTSPSGSFKPQVREIPLREVRSIDSLPSQTRGINGIVVSPRQYNNLKRTSSDYSQPSLQAAVAMLRRSSTFANGMTLTNYSSPTDSSRPPSDLRPAPLNVPQSATAAYFRRPSSPTSVYTDAYDNRTSGSKTPPSYASYGRYGSISSSAPRSAPADRTSFLNSPASTDASTPTASQAPRSPPADVQQQNPASPMHEAQITIEHLPEEPPNSQQHPQPPPRQTSQEEPEGSTPPPLQSPRAAAPERVPTPPRPKRMDSQTAPERIPTPPRSPELKALTSATVTGPEPDFPYGWADDDAASQVEEPEELDASPPPVELSARPATSDGPDPESRRESENSNLSQNTDRSSSTEKADTTSDEDAEDRLLRRRSDTILRKEIEEQRKRDIAAAKRELEELNRANETKKAQADIISRVAQKTGVPGVAPPPVINGNVEDPVREQLFPTGDTKLLHKPPPVIINNVPGTSPPRGRPSAEQNRLDPGSAPPSSGSQFVYPSHSPLAASNTGLSPPEPEDNSTALPSPGANNKSRSPWRKVFNFGGSGSGNHSHNSSVEESEKPEKEKRGLGISLGLGRKSHRKSRSSVKEARLAQAADRHSPEGGAALSDGRVIRHGGWNSGDVNPIINGAGAGLKSESPNGLGNGVNGEGDRQRYLPMRDEGTQPIPGVGTMDFGRASVQMRREQERNGHQIVIGGQNHGIGDVPDIPAGARF